VSDDERSTSNKQKRHKRKSESQSPDASSHSGVDNINHHYRRGDGA